jgi:hypothetical protein
VINVRSRPLKRHNARKDSITKRSQDSKMGYGKHETGARLIREDLKYSTE